MTDLIARLEEQMARKFGFPTRRWMDLAVSVEDVSAILRALKVQQAAEEWEQSRQNVANRASPEAEQALSRAVKGEQPG